jgi:hypothetical protein
MIAADAFVFPNVSVGVFVAAASVLAGDISGIWTGEQQGRRGEPEEIAFQFKVQGGALTGRLFGDEFDLPVSEATLTGDQIRFTITATITIAGRRPSSSTPAR